MQKNLKFVLESEKAFVDIVLIDIQEWNQSNFRVEENHYFFVFLPHLLKREVPYHRTFIYLMEQNLDGNLNTRYLDAMSNNIVFKNLLEQSVIFDYSNCNIDVWKKRVKRDFSENIKLLLPPVSSRIVATNNKIYDVLFFGSLNPRREMIINELKRLNIKVKVINYERWGDDLINEIKKAKVVLNIHYYDNAILEKPRISEALPYTKVISEMPCHADIDSYDKYKDTVKFVPIINDIHDVTSLAEMINSILVGGEKDKIREKTIYDKANKDDKFNSKK